MSTRQFSSCSQNDWVKLTWFEVQCSERLWVEEVEGGANCEQHVVVMSFIQDDKNQIAYLETEGNKRETKEWWHRLLQTYHTFM